MVNITDVKQILQFAIDAEIKVFLDGGWGVDALLGYDQKHGARQRQPDRDEDRPVEWRRDLRL